MALIKCPECGATVSDKAAACPQCGMPIAAAAGEKKIKVHFEREKAFRGSALYGTVVIDGVPVGSASSGASFDVMLTPGTHNVMIDTNISGRGETRLTSESYTLEIPEDAKSVFVEILIKASFKSAIMSGVAGELAIGNISVRRY